MFLVDLTNYRLGLIDKFQSTIGGVAGLALITGEPIDWKDPSVASVSLAYLTLGAITLLCFIRR